MNIKQLKTQNDITTTFWFKWIIYYLRKDIHKDLLNFTSSYSTIIFFVFSLFLGIRHILNLIFGKDQDPKVMTIN